MARYIKEQANYNFQSFPPKNPENWISPSVHCGTISTVNVFAVEIVPQLTEGWISRAILSHSPSVSSILISLSLF